MSGAPKVDVPFGHDPLFSLSGYGVARLFKPTLEALIAALLCYDEVDEDT